MRRPTIHHLIVVLLLVLVGYNVFLTIRLRKVVAVLDEIAADASSASSYAQSADDNASTAAQYASDALDAAEEAKNYAADASENAYFNRCRYCANPY